VPVRDDRLRGVLEKVAPGTALREGIDRIIRSGKGAIIILGAPERVEPILSGGFQMDTRFTAQRLSELAKMDGAIVVDEEVEQVLWANVQLVPDPTIPTNETGTRHRTAERVARQTGVPVVAVSESMRLVSLYIDGTKHTLEELSNVLFRANQALATLERYRSRLDEVSARLSALELGNAVSLRDVCSVLQRAEMVRRITDEVESPIAELGTDGRLIQLQLEELLFGVEDERRLVVRDYRPDRQQHVEGILAELDALRPNQLLDLSRIAGVLGYREVDDGLDTLLTPRGFRLLSRIPRLPQVIIERLVQRYGSLRAIMDASVTDLNEVEGIGQARARAIREGLDRLNEASLHDRFS